MTFCFFFLEIMLIHLKRSCSGNENSTVVIKQWPSLIKVHL